MTSRIGNFFQISASIFKKGRGHSFAANFTESGAKSSVAVAPIAHGLGTNHGWGWDPLDAVAKTFGVAQQVNPRAL